MSCVHERCHAAAQRPQKGVIFLNRRPTLEAKPVTARDAFERAGWATRHTPRVASTVGVPASAGAAMLVPTRARSHPGVRVAAATARMAMLPTSSFARALRSPSQPLSEC